MNASVAVTASTFIRRRRQMRKKKGSKKSKRKGTISKNVDTETFKLDSGVWTYLNILAMEQGNISCRDFLEMVVKAFANEPQTPAYEKFLSDGRVFVDWDEILSENLRRKHKLLDRRCFPNCQFIWQKYPSRYRYCEGIFRNVAGECIEHAWLIGRRGRVVDPTNVSIAAEYFGVELPDDKVEEWILKNDGPSGSLLFPGFQKPYVYDTENACWDSSEFDEYMQRLNSKSSEIGVGAAI